MDWLKKLFVREPAKQVEQVIEPKPEPEPKVDPFTAEYHDWEKRCGSWHQATLCHCGYVAETRYSLESQCDVSVMPRGNVCPMCGHTDKWEDCVVRRESEFSKTKRKMILQDNPHWSDPFNRYAAHHFSEHESAYRNIKTVRWTEDHCKISEDSSQ